MVRRGGSAAAATLDQIRDSKAIRIADREDAPPFSYRGGDGRPAGFMIDLCRWWHVASDRNSGAVT